MIIDQLPLLSGDVQTTDEIPIERGTTTYKTTQAALVKSAADAAAAAQSTADAAQTTADAAQTAAGNAQTAANAAQQTANSKQDALVSGVNIKTVGGQSLLGSGNIDAGGSWALLWTNPNPSAAFPAQTISLDLSNYAEFVIKVYQWKDDGQLSGQVYILGYQIYNYNIFTPIITNGQVYLAGRQIITKANGVEVTSGGAKTSLTGNFAQDDGWIVPAEIWAK